jgi:hypothetical protein
MESLHPSHFAQSERLPDTDGPPGPTAADLARVGILRVPTTRIPIPRDTAAAFGHAHIVLPPEATN